MDRNWDFDDRLNVNGNNWNDDDNGHSFGIALPQTSIKMKTHSNIYSEIYSLKNLILAWKKARKGKTKKLYVIDFEDNLAYNLKILHDGLKSQTYFPKPLKTFVLRDPKTRKISKSDFRDRIVHHAINNILEPIFDKGFISDNCASRKRKGTQYALKRFDKFKRKVTKNLTSEAFCFKADIKHYFQEINHELLIKLISQKIKCKNTLELITRILENPAELERERERRGRDISTKGVPLGNLTSQLFANIYLNEFDQFIKHKLNVKYYVRYVDDFIIFHKSKTQLKKWSKEIKTFLERRLILKLHPDKSKIIKLSKGVDFVGFRNFYHHKLLRKRNIRNMERKIIKCHLREISKEKLSESFEGWKAYADWANTHKLKKKIANKTKTE